jgi:hypothetical protein
VRKGERGEERDTTTHLIKNSTFTHASRVTKFSTLILRRRQRSWEFRLVRPDDKALGAFPCMDLRSC